MALGLTVGFNVILGGSVSGASMNPARSFGPALIVWNFGYQWIYWVAPILGGLIAAGLYMGGCIWDYIKTWTYHRLHHRHCRDEPGSSCQNSRQESLYWEKTTDFGHNSNIRIGQNFNTEHKNMLSNLHVVVSKGYLAINPQYDKLLTILRTAYANELSLDKDQT